MKPIIYCGSVALTVAVVLGAFADAPKEAPPPQGESTSDNPKPLRGSSGACCFDTPCACTETSGEAECLNSGGSFFYDEFSCSFNPCGCLEGACCHFDTDSCQDGIGFNDCLLGSIHFPGVSCASLDPPCNQLTCPCNADLVMGDVIDVDDILAILDGFSGVFGYHISYDVNCDSTIDAYDIESVLCQFTVGTSEFCCQGCASAPLPSSAMLSAVPFGDPNATGNEVVEVEFFITALDDLTIHGGQIDIPCTLSGGTAGTFMTLAGFAGGTTDPQGDALRGPSQGGIPYLFGPGGLGQYDPTACRFALTPGVGAPPATLSMGTTRYVGTVFYQASSCSAGTFSVNFEGASDPPVCGDATRFWSRDAMGMHQLFPLTLTGTNINVPTGACCQGPSCVADGLNAFCCVSNFPFSYPSWPGASCAEPGTCGCIEDASCDDGNSCTIDTCSATTGQCTNAPRDCPGTTDCKIGVCNPNANGGAGACTIQNRPNGTACDVQGTCDDTCMTGVCVPGPTCAVFGDIVDANFNPNPNCLVDIDDLTCLLNDFQNPDACLGDGDLVRADFFCAPDGIIDASDLLAMLDCFAGIFACPDPCGP